MVSVDELRSALASSVLAPSTLVWREGMASWVPAFTVPELGVAAPAELPADGNTDIAATPGVSGGAELSGITSADREPPQPEWGSGSAPARPGAAVQPPPLVTPHKVVSSAVTTGSTADTGRPTPTQLLDVSAQGTAQNSPKGPRPAAGREAGAPIKISAAPRPLAASAPAPAQRPAAGKSEGAAAAAPKAAAQRPGAWRKPEGGKKHDDDVTLVAEASEPFKLKASGEGAAPIATPSPNKPVQGQAKEPGRVASSLATRRPVTSTSAIPETDAPANRARPAAGRPASVPPAPVRRPSSAPPAASPRPPSVAPGPPQRTPGTPSAATADPIRSTAFMGSGARSPEAGGGAAVPVAPRIPNLVRPPFAIVENTSTDSTGVLPLSGQYAAEPKPDPRPHAPSFVDGAPPFAEHTPQAPAATQGPVLLGAASPEPARDAQPSHPRAEQRSYSPAMQASHSPAAQSAPGSYPPVPQPMFGGPHASGEIHPAPHAHGAAPSPANPVVPAPHRQVATMRMNSQPPSGYAATPMPYSAPPPPLALAHPSIPDVRSANLTEPPPGEMRATGAMPLVNPKRSYTPPPLDQVDPAAQPPEAFDEPPAKVGDPVTVPLSSLFGAGGILIAMAVAAFFIGRCSVPPGSDAPPARAALGALPRLARASLPAPPKPCWMAKQPVRWAATVLQSVPVDVAPTASGVVVAYARDAREPATVQVEFASGTFDDKPADKLTSDIVRVIAPRDGGKLLATTRDDTGPLAPYTFAPGASPFVIGVAGRGTPSPSVAVADKPEGTPVTLWTVPAVEEDKGLEAARVLAYGQKTHALVFRRSGNILGGFVSEGRKAEGALGVVAGSGGSIGKPSLGTNQREIAVIFADKSQGDAPWEIRVGHAPLGQMPRETMVVPLPKGGPGGDAFAPDIAGTADGRWVIVWTEGKTGAYAVRAQTFSADFKPLGDPIAISPPAGNFGQAVVGSAGGYVTTMFLSKGASGSYELWGAVLQCGS